MKHVRGVLGAGACLIAFGLLGSCSRSAVAMDPGEWEMTAEITNVSGDNMPADARRDVERMREHPQRSRSCMPASADVIRIQNLRFEIPDGRSRGDCTVEELSMEGGAIKGRLNCRGLPQNIDINASLDGTYSADDLSMTGRVEVTKGRENGSVELRVTGRRVGDCQRPSRPPPMPTPVAPANPYDSNTLDMNTIDNGMGSMNSTNSM